MTLCLCMIAKNEEAFIADAIRSAKPFVDSILIGDTGSSDATKSIAVKESAQVIDVPWTDDFSAAKNAVLEEAKADHVIFLDADERIAPQDWKKLKAMIGQADGFTLVQRTYSRTKIGDVLPNAAADVHGFVYPLAKDIAITRAFRKNPAYFFRNRVHELIDDSIAEAGGKIADSGIVIHHYGLVREDRSVQGKLAWYGRLVLLQVQEHPESSRYQFQAGLHFMENQDFVRAEQHFTKAASLEKSPKTLLYLARARLARHAYAAALEAYEQMLSLPLSKLHAAAYNDAAVLAAKLSDRDKALSLLDDGLKHFPNHPALLRNRQSIKN
ncbi:glycosyltransferase [Candidatus Woesearchaeota archaeon]|nr:glycosyltransferase [Candidatus Woesearchaeota archaeon]